LRLPSIEQSLTQIALASVDQAIAAAVLYVLLPSNAAIDFATFLGIYIVAAPLSLLSLVPGGLGVFETALLVVLADSPKAASLASLIAYRFIYFLLPLALAVACEAVYEFRRASKSVS
jgi:glycosyltransferase 2 family protein